jgi:hypothetical protein
MDCALDKAENERPSAQVVSMIGLAGLKRNSTQLTSSASCERIASADVLFDAYDVSRIVRYSDDSWSGWAAR